MGVLRASRATLPLGGCGRPGICCCVSDASIGVAWAEPGRGTGRDTALCLWLKKTFGARLWWMLFGGRWAGNDRYRGNGRSGIGPEGLAGLPCELNAGLSHGTISPPRCLSLNRRGPRAPFAPAFAVLHRICCPYCPGCVRAGPRCPCSGDRATSGGAGPALGRPGIP